MYDYLVPYQKVLEVGDRITIKHNGRDRRAIILKIVGSTLTLKTLGKYSQVVIRGRHEVFTEASIFHAVSLVILVTLMSLAFIFLAFSIEHAI